MASDQAKGRRQAEQSAAAELLRQEREKIARLERELQSAQQTANVPAVAPAITTGRVTQDPQPGANAIRPGATAQTSIAATRTNARPDPVNAAEAARLVARASVLLGQGDIGSARSVLERAVDAGDAQASFALAETYDPLILRRWGAYGTLGDAARARDLYARAQAGGIKEARERLDALRR
jgi:hypothetical protein